MLSRSRISLVAVLCFMIAALTCGEAIAATVTVNVAGKSAKSDVKTLNPKAVRVLNDQVGVYIENTLLSPHQLKVKFDGLKNKNYDVYANGDYVGEKSPQDFKDGIEWTIPGTVADEAAMRCLHALTPKVNQAYNSIHARKGAEQWRAAYTLGQAEGWVKSGIRTDEAYRSVALVVVPAGESLGRMVFASRQDKEGTAKGVLNCCDLLHTARANMYNVLTDADLRNEVVEALTPVTFTASYSMKNGKPSITANIVNDCDLTITGEITISAPEGWKTVGGKFDIGKLESGKTFTTSFSLTRSAKNAAMPKSVPLTAVVDIMGKEMGARLWLFATPACAKP